jgi:hypothetical protein
VNPKRVLSKEAVEAHLASLDLEKTDIVTATGRFWKSTKTGRHVQVPEPYDGMYPEFILADLRVRLEELGLGSMMH